MVIDFHSHCFPDGLAERAIAELEGRCDIKAVHNGTVSGLRESTIKWGVDLSVVLPVATKPSQVGTINKWALENSGGRLKFFGAVHPDDQDFYSTVKWLKENGFPGVKLHPDYQNFFADEERIFPLYEALRDAGLIVVFHSGMDIGLPVPIHCTPLMIKKVFDNFKGLTIVAAHMGAHALWRDVEDLLAGTPVYIDTSYSQYMLGNSGMERIIRKHGSERVLFGTDSPWKRADKEINAITSLDLPEDDIDNILCNNALTLLNHR